MRAHVTPETRANVYRCLEEEKKHYNSHYLNEVDPWMNNLRNRARVLEMLCARNGEHGDAAVSASSYEELVSTSNDYDTLTDYPDVTKVEDLLKHKYLGSMVNQVAGVIYAGNPLDSEDTVALPSMRKIGKWGRPITFQNIDGDTTRVFVRMYPSRKSSENANTWGAKVVSIRTEYYNSASALGRSHVRTGIFRDLTIYQESDAKCDNVNRVYSRQRSREHQDGAQLFKLTTLDDHQTVTKDAIIHMRNHMRRLLNVLCNTNPEGSVATDLFDLSTKLRSTSHPAERRASSYPNSCGDLIDETFNIPGFGDACNSLRTHSNAVDGKVCLEEDTMSHIFPEGVKIPGRVGKSRKAEKASQAKMESHADHYRKEHKLSRLLHCVGWMVGRPLEQGLSMETMIRNVPCVPNPYYATDGEVPSEPLSTKRMLDATRDVLALTHLPMILYLNTCNLTRDAIPATFARSDGHPFLLAAALRLAMVPHKFGLHMKLPAAGVGLRHLASLLKNNFYMIDDAIVTAIRAATMMHGVEDPGPLAIYADGTANVDTIAISSSPSFSAYSYKWHGAAHENVVSLARAGRRLAECLWGAQSKKFASVAKSQNPYDSTCAADAPFERNLFGNQRSMRLHVDEHIANAEFPPWPLWMVSNAEVQQTALRFFHEVETNLRAQQAKDLSQDCLDNSTTNQEALLKHGGETDGQRNMILSAFQTLKLYQKSENFDDMHPCYDSNLTRAICIGINDNTYKDRDEQVMAERMRQGMRDKALSDGARESMPAPSTASTASTTSTTRTTSTAPSKEEVRANYTKSWAMLPPTTAKNYNDMRGTTLLTHYLAFGADGVTSTAGLDATLVSPYAHARCVHCDLAIPSLDTLIALPGRQCIACEGYYCLNCYSKNSANPTCLGCQSGAHEAWLIWASVESSARKETEANVD